MLAGQFLSQLKIIEFFQKSNYNLNYAKRIYKS